MKAAKNRVVIYAATFIPIVDVEDSVQSQIEHCKAVIANARPTFTVIGSYQDEVRSRDAKRPSFEALILDAQSKKFEYIALTDLKLLDPDKQRRNEILELLEKSDIAILKVAKAPKKKVEKNAPRHIKWVPDPEMLSLFDVMAKKKTVEEHEAEFGSRKKGDSSE
jgi:hypothetical protein